MPSKPLLPLVAILVLLVATTACPAQDRPSLEAAAGKLADGIRKAGFTRVAVMPLAFEEDLRRQQKEDVDRRNAGGSILQRRAAGSRRVRIDGAREDQGDGPTASASLHARLLTEQMESLLAEAAGGDFRVMPSAPVLDRLREKPAQVAALAPTGESLAEPIRAAGDVEAVVVGTLRDRFEEADNGGAAILTFEMLDVAWKLVGLDDNSIRAAANATRFVSLADEVYRGRSGEFFRWEGDRLKVLQSVPPADRAKIPLAPGDSIDLHAPPGFNRDLNPLFNPSCPYKVRYLVEGKARPLTIAVDEKPSQRFRAPSQTMANWGGHAYLAVEPGESVEVRVKNTTSKRARVAVFVDGVNILGKRRELPDERCGAWVLEKGVEANFRGWYSGGKDSTLLERFVLGRWEDSVAGQLDLEADARESQLITVVVFSEGWPERAKLSFFERMWSQHHWWDPGTGRIVVSEKLEPPGSLGAAPSLFGMAGLKPEAAKIQWVAADNPGTILAAMSVGYGPQTQASLRMGRRLDGIVGFNGNWKLVTTPPAGQ